MSKIETIEILAKTLEENNLDVIEYKDEDFSIKLEKNHQNLKMQTVETDVDNLDIVATNFTTIMCPLVGHFYLSKTPLEKPLINVGDKIQKGDVIAVVQAMKVSNEIISDVDGVVCEILVNNGDFVDFDHPLVKVELN